MASAAQNFSYFKGEDVTVTVTMVPVISISGWSLVFSVKNLYDDTAPVLQKTSLAGEISITDPTNGVFVLLLPAATALTPRSYYFEFARVNSGSETVLVYGSMTVKPRTEA